jgi:hypothetical protein
MSPLVSSDFFIIGVSNMRATGGRTLDKNSLLKALYLIGFILMVVLVFSGCSDP